MEIHSTDEAQEKVREMAYERKVGESALFKNTRVPKLSDCNGTIDLACPCGKTTTYFIDGWRKTMQSGARYLSIRLKAKGPKTEPTTSAAAAADDMDW